MNTIYKIKRFLLLCEEQKEFSINSIEDLMTSSKDKYFLYYQPCLNIMKLIEMFYYVDSNGKDQHKHWLDMTINSIKNYSNFAIPQIYFGWIEDDLSNVFGENIIEIFSKDFNNPIDFIRFLKYHLLNDKKEDSIKYNKWFKDNPISFSDEDYLYFYRYIALCVSKQLNPEIHKPYDSLIRKKIFKLKINYTKDMFSDKNLLKEIIYKCIKNILYVEEN